MEPTTTPKISLRASFDFNKVEVPIGDHIIQASTFLKNLTETCSDDTTLDVNMTTKQLQQFVTFFDHYPSADTKPNKRFETKFFLALPDDEFFALCKAVDFFDCDRFTEAAADFVVQKKIPGMATSEIRKYLGIKNDLVDVEVEIFDSRNVDYFKNNTN